jgi:hypothetical protein
MGQRSSYCKLRHKKEWYITFSLAGLSDPIINFIDLINAIMASSGNIPMKTDISIIVGKV